MGAKGAGRGGEARETDAKKISQPARNWNLSLLADQRAGLDLSDANAADTLDDKVRGRLCEVSGLHLASITDSCPSTTFQLCRLSHALRQIRPCSLAPHTS